MADTFTITDNRTGKSVEVPVHDGGISSKGLRELDPNLYFYDPSYMQTAACRSTVTYIDGDAGILRYTAIRSSSSPISRHTWRWPTF